MKEFGLRRKLALYDEAEVRRQIEQEMEGPGCMAGYRSMWHTLSMKGIRVPRRVVEEIMGELDPEGCETRRRKRLRRRKYRAPGPNYVLARGRLRQTQTIRFPNTWMHRWVEQKDHVATIG